MRVLPFVFAGAAAALLFVEAGVSQAGQTLDSIKSKGSLRCGVNTGLAGFAQADPQGKWTGLDVDLCRAISAALFGNPDKVDYVPLNAQQRFTALQSGEIDVLVRNTTWTLTRDASLGIVFTGVNFYDGQGFMVAKDLGVRSALELDGASVCVQPGTTTELNLADYFRANNMTFNPVVIEALDQSIEAFFSGRCQVYTTDKSGLAAIIANNAPNPANYAILPETISKEPLGPAVRRGDDEWFSIVKWVNYALIEAEEYGVNSKNVDDLKAKSTNPVVQRLLGVSGEMGVKLGLPNEWAATAVKLVGNYGEIYARNVGPGTSLNLERGLNEIWTKGGLMYAMPVR